MSSGGSGFQGWPALAKAAYRGQQLRLEELYDGLLLIPEAFNVDECREMIRAVEATGELVSTNPRNLPPRKGHAFRNNERYLVRLAELPHLEPQPESLPPVPAAPLNPIPPDLTAPFARMQVRDEAFAARLFEYLRPVLSCIVRPEDGATPNGLNPDFRFYR